MSIFSVIKRYSRIIERFSGSTILSCLLCIILPAYFSGCMKNRETQHPNVIILLADDQGYGDLACHGDPLVETPNMDQLYNESYRFTDFHVDPTCAPTRSSLMTGKYSHRVGVWHTLMSRDLLRAEETTMADVFKENGYGTGIFGKWHLGFNYPFRPIDRGFDQWFSLTDPRYWAMDKMDDHYNHHDQWEYKKGFTTDVVFDEAINFIEQSKDRPFFVYLAPFEPHKPWNVPSDWVKKYLDKDIVDPMAYFFAQISRLDYNLGRLRRYLGCNGLDQNTIFIYMSDNGSACQSKQNFNAGMRGFKGSVYEGGHRVPFFLRLPGMKANSGTDVDILSAHIDLLPSLIELCHLHLKEHPDFDGRSFVPYLEGDTVQKDRFLLVESQRVKDPVKGKDFVIMSNEWRLVNGKLLFNIEKDPGQVDEISDLHPHLVDSMQVFYDRIWQEISENDHIWQRCIIGSDQQLITRLYCEEWVPVTGGEPPWRFENINQAPKKKGWWPITVCDAGTFEFRLRRYPTEVSCPIHAMLPAKDTFDIFQCGPNGQPIPVRMGEGKAIPATNAKLILNNREYVAALDPGSEEVVFQVDLEPGDFNVQGVFYNEKEEWGVYYLYVQEVNG